MLLEVSDLHAYYRDFQALFGVSLDVGEGEIVAIIGSNGAGKSTFLRSVCGLLSSTPEAIRFCGATVGHLAAYRRAELGISMVPEGRRIFPGLSVAENLLVGAFAHRPGPWTTARVFEMFPSLERIADRVGRVLSGGEQQALAIARALMSNPRLLLLDEISLGLAPLVVKQLYTAIPAIATEGCTIVLVEQDVTQALRVADRAYCFLEGRVSLEGRPADLTREAVAAAYFGI